MIIHERLDGGESFTPRIDFSRYGDLGGRINEEDYLSAMERATSSRKQSESLRGQVKHTAKVAQIDLNDIVGGPENLYFLYGVLRDDVKPNVEHHHGQMSDERLVVEALRMLDNPDFLEKVIAAYPNIDFN